MPVMEVNQFVTPQALEDFHGRYRAIYQAIQELELTGAGPDETPALAFGSGAWALQGIDGHLPEYGPFDLDTVVGDAMFKRISQSEDGFTGGIAPLTNGGFHGVMKPSAAIPLKVDMLNAPWVAARYIGSEQYTGEQNAIARMTPLGVLAVNANVIALRKTMYKHVRVKDLASIIKAHVVADYQDHPLVGDEMWLQAVGDARSRLLNNKVDDTPFIRRITGRGYNHSSWLQQLIRADFEHPAFANVPQ